jgi:hypothetical protein
VTLVSFVRRAFVVASLVHPSISYGQTPFTLGLPLDFTGIVPVTTPQTIVDANIPFSLDGQLTTASFGWSATPCPSAAKIKFFRPFIAVPGVVLYNFLTERGPFDVRSDSSVVGQPVIQTVALDPPVSVKSGDLIGIATLGTCGGPIYTANPPFSPFTLTAFDVPGDFGETLPRRQNFYAVAVQASGISPELGLLGNRFVVTLAATNPRTGVQTIATPNRISDAAGYFSLPDFTGDPTFLEVMVKMVDASRVPALGGDFWFFHAPLTDAQYRLTVKDQATGIIRTYSNTSGSPGQLCGGADTSAFPGP